MIYYQIVFIDLAKKDADYNEAGMVNIFKTKIEAWKEVLQDCDNDEDITYLMDRISGGFVFIKELYLKDD